MRPTLSIICPTVGRSTLRQTIASCVHVLEEGDELLVVADGCRPEARRIVREFLPAPLSYSELYVPGSTYGNGQRDLGMRMARGSHLLFLDDDDVYMYAALDAVRAALLLDETSIETAHVFRATWGPGHHAHGVTLPADEVVREANIATPCVVLSNRPYGRSWLDGNARGTVSDFAFLAAALGECGEPVWHADVIAMIRP